MGQCLAGPFIAEKSEGLCSRAERSGVCALELLGVSDIRPVLRLV